MRIDDYTQTPYFLSNRLLRFLWLLVYWCFFRLTPRPMHLWRALVLKMFGAKLGRHCHIYPDVVIWAPWNLVCQQNTCIGSGVNIYNHTIISIGKHSVISQGSYLCTATHDYNNKHFKLVKSPIHIGAHCWIAAQSFVNPGITIGEGCVIGARSVVVHNLPPWCICVGHPCKPIKHRTHL